LEEGTILVQGGKIVAVGASAEIEPPAGATVRDMRGRVIMPGIVDTHSHVGISPRPDVEAHADGNEATDPIQSGLRALDAIWPGDPGIRMAVAGGVTTANIMPGSANVMGGQTAYVKLRGKTIEEMLIHKEGVQGGMKMANGENPKRSHGPRGRAPATRMKVAALQRSIFIKAQDYVRAWETYERAVGEGKTGLQRPDRNLDLEPVVEILKGQRTVHFHTHRADDILTALRLADEFGFKIVLQHVSEGHLVAEEIARRNAPCSIIVTESPGGKLEAVQLRMDNAAALERAGVKVAFHSDDNVVNSRFLLREAALAVRAGMSEQGALRALTLHAAEMMDLADRIGSIEPGKDADLVVLSGPPFSVRTQVLETYIDGEQVFDRARPADRRFATGGFDVGERYPTLEGAP